MLLNTLTEITANDIIVYGSSYSCEAVGADTLNGSLYVNNSVVIIWTTPNISVFWTTKNTCSYIFDVFS